MFELLSYSLLLFCAGTEMQYINYVKLSGNDGRYLTVTGYKTLSLCYFISEVSSYSV
jgi:hypothetical protein